MHSILREYLKVLRLQKTQYALMSGKNKIIESLEQLKQLAGKKTGRKQNLIKVKETTQSKKLEASSRLFEATQQQRKK